MVSKSNPGEAVSCDQCGKTKGNGTIGTHWICEDCKVNASMPAQESQDKPKT